MRAATVGAALACFTLSGQAAENKAGDPNTASRNIPYRKGDFVSIPTQVGYPTLLELPGKDQAVLPICGVCRPLDAAGGSEGGQEEWIVQGIKDSNLVAIQPLKAGAKTVVHILGSSGIVYTLDLREVSRQAGAHADVRIVLTAGDPGLLSALSGGERFVSADRADAYKQEAAAARKALEEEKKREETRAAQEKESLRQKVEAGIKHNYKYDQNSKTAALFNVRSMYEDNGFLVIEASPEELPVIYEKKDGKDSLIQFDVRDGKYYIPKLPLSGYLRVGKAKLDFHREG